MRLNTENGASHGNLRPDETHRSHRRPRRGKDGDSRRLAKDDPDRLLAVAEAASAIYASMAARWDRLNLDGRRDVQRKIYHLQLDQEHRLSAEHQRRTLICDRGTVDGAAYWPDGPEAYWRDLNTTIATELARYELVIWLETSAILGEYDGSALKPRPIRRHPGCRSHRPRSGQIVGSPSAVLPS